MMTPYESKHVARFQCITFNAIFGYEHQYTIVALDCGFYFLLSILYTQRDGIYKIKTIHKVTSNVQSVPRQSPDIY
jgi:hypothetical protein